MKIVLLRQSGLVIRNREVQKLFEPALIMNRSFSSH